MRTTRFTEAVVWEGGAESTQRQPLSHCVQDGGLCADTCCQVLACVHISAPSSRAGHCWGLSAPRTDRPRAHPFLGPTGAVVLALPGGVCFSKARAVAACEPRPRAF